MQRRLSDKCGQKYRTNHWKTTLLHWKRIYHSSDIGKYNLWYYSTSSSSELESDKNKETAVTSVAIFLNLYNSLFVLSNIMDNFKQRTKNERKEKYKDWKMKQWQRSKRTTKTNISSQLERLNRISLHKKMANR